MPKNCAEHINNKLKTAKTVDIFCHTSSDEDTFNSAKAMYSYLKGQSITPRLVVSNASENYDYDVKKYNIIQADEINDSTKKADLGLCVDFSSPNRVSPNVLKYIKDYGNNIVGFDHHNDPTLVTPDFNKITQSYAKTQAMPAIEAKDYYIDASAKSNCAIISRFFDAIGHKINKDEARSLLTGMFDDTYKEGISKVDTFGRIKVTDKANDNGNTKTVMNNVLDKLNIMDKLSVLKHCSDKTKLTKKELNFQAGLDKRVKYSSNGKFAYIEITSEDKEWQNLGHDTERSKKVLSNFRKSTLAKNKNLDAVAVFYPTNIENTYKMSLLTREDYAKQMIEHIKTTTCPEIVAGGHENRSGGTIVTENTQKCHEWVNLFKQSADAVLR